MKTNLTEAMLAIVLLCIASSASAGLAGSRYSITVKVSDGMTVFHECLAFDDNGTLTMTSRLNPMAWAQTREQYRAVAFSATHPGEVIFRGGYGLALHGHLNAQGILIGNAINEYGTTFTFRGVERIGCTGKKDYDYFSMVTAFPARQDQPKGDTQATQINGQKPLAARKDTTYQVSYFAEEWHQDCWHFSPAGHVWADSGFDLIWQTESSSTRAAAFQATGPQTLGASYAIHGQFLEDGGISVSGVMSTKGKTVAMYGFGHFDQVCVQD